MGTSTFSGPLRSQDSLKLISKDTTSGLIQDRTLHGNAAKDTRRYYLEEWFTQLPKLNAVNVIDPDANDASALALHVLANKNFEVLGTNMTSALSTRNATAAGITLTTAGADADQAIVLPHLDANQTAWTGNKWGTENQTVWECSINTNAIDNQKLWAGLKLTNDQLVATDDDQAFFKFQTDATNSEAFTDFTKWHFVHSVGGTDFISVLPITVVANTIYHLKIEIDSARKLSIFVDGQQYNITTTSGSTGGTAVTTGPYIGIEAGAAAAEAVDVHYQCISRTLFE